jgi:hypothetical protein
MNDVSWINFVRQYGPGARTDSMYDETIQRSVRRTGIEPILFEHPAQGQLFSCFDKDISDPVSVILTGTAGDGKTHLCRQVWNRLGGDGGAWASDNPYLSLKYSYPKIEGGRFESDDVTSRDVTIHIIRDLSAWAPQQGLPWEASKELLLQKLCRSLFDNKAGDIFLVAANDGQLIESWRRLADTEHVVRARKLFEDLLVDDRQELEGVRLRMFNLSRWNSADLFERAYKAFIEHSGWRTCYEGVAGEDEAFGLKCPIRHNLELLKTPLVYGRLRSLIELCDHSGLHLPIRQILLLLSNAVLGCAWDQCKDRLMKPADIPHIIRKGMLSQCSLYNNIFGGNLSENRRQSLTIFDYFDRFQVGHET